MNRIYIIISFIGIIIGIIAIVGEKIEERADKRRIKDLTPEFEKLMREHERAPKGPADRIIFRVYHLRLPMGSYSMCVDRYRDRIYEDGFKYKTSTKIRQYIIEMKDEIARLHRNESIRKQAEAEAAYRRQKEEEKEEDLRLHPWKKHSCDECKHYSWRCYPDGDVESKCGYTGRIYGYTATMRERKTCEHFERK